MVLGNKKLRRLENQKVGSPEIYQLSHFPIFLPSWASPSHLQIRVYPCSSAITLILFPIFSFLNSGISIRLT
jgi:hypothetical protein